MRSDKRSPEGVLAELKALQRAYGAAQRRCTLSLQRLHARNQALEAEVLELRAQLATRDADLFLEGRAAVRLAPHNGERSSRLAWGARMELLAQRLLALWKKGEVRSPVPEAEDVLDCLTPAHGWAGQAAKRPAGNTVQEGLPREAAVSHRWVDVGEPLESSPGSLSTEDKRGALHGEVPVDHGTAENCADPSDLEERLVEADLVICQTGCLSHQDYWRVQDHCRRHNKPCVLVAQPEALRIIRIHQRGDVAGSWPGLTPAVPRKSGTDGGCRQNVRAQERHEGVGADGR
ncbi:MAG: DUF2325 domain-containing protein [Lautropia sp.]|nr:DUF2325 domain-containing protein [Lautropia sp.]